MFTCKDSKVTNKIIYPEEKLEFIIKKQVAIASSRDPDLHNNKQFKGIYKKELNN